MFGIRRGKGGPEGGMRKGGPLAESPADFPGTPSDVPSEGPERPRRLRLRFCGEVQGVGFRWTSQIVARRVGCTGWVRNESDGSVSMELQGTQGQISSWFGGFSAAYARYPIDYRIDEKDDVEPLGGEKDFEVRFY